MEAAGSFKMSSSSAASVAPIAKLSACMSPPGLHQSCCQGTCMTHLQRECDKCKHAWTSNPVDPGRVRDAQEGKQKALLCAMPADEGQAVIKNLYLPGNKSCPKPAFQGTTPGVIQIMQFALLYRIVHLNEQSHKDNLNRSERACQR